MKTPLLLIIPLLFFSLASKAQITTAAVNAYFGVDADLKARNVDGTVQSSDDWYLHPTAGGNAINGTFVIDTTGAAAVLAGYNSDVSPFPKRMASIYRTMAAPPFTVVNNRLWLDALFIRDYHGADSTVFTAGSDKNGASPVNWSGGIQGIPDKNDILDMFMHVRRSGPNSTYPLWFFGGLSLDNVTGNRYFDFEMYQTDIYYDRPSAKWYGYGPNAGHTIWQFDASGNVLKPGDVIFSAEYQSSSLTKIEARIWVDKSALSITPTQFSWSGQFDGDGSGAQYGYASILPKTAGDFYTGMQCGNSEWAGAFSLVRQDNSLSTTYVGKQFMEFSVNLTKLGLDPATIFGNDICGTPFNRIVVKTRASASFTSELKDFVAPTDLFLAPRVDALADVPLFCGNLNNASILQVTNPTATSVYTWTTLNGRIVTNPVATSVTADSAGTYIVTQQLMAGCSVFATDTVSIVYEPDCTTLNGGKVDFKVNYKEGWPLLNWISNINNKVTYYEIQRSYNGRDFESIEKIENINPSLSLKSYIYTDNSAAAMRQVYYRLKLIAPQTVSYSRIVMLDVKGKSGFTLLPNPARSFARIYISTTQNEQAKMSIYNLSGHKLSQQSFPLNQGQNTLQLNELNRLPEGMYLISIQSPSINQWQKLIIKR